MKLIFCFLILFIPTIIIGQNNFNLECDSDFVVSNKNLIDCRKDAFTINPEFELRIWIEGGCPTIPRKADNLINLIYNNKNWYLYHYKFHYKRGAKIKVEKIKVENIDFDSLYHFILQNNLLTLPRQGFLLWRAFEEHKYEMTFGDGVQYRFEILTQKCGRTYTYIMPTEYWNSHKYIEYQNIINILSRLYTLTRINRKIY